MEEKHNKFSHFFYNSNWAKKEKNSTTKWMTWKQNESHKDLKNAAGCLTSMTHTYEHSNVYTDFVYALYDNRIMRADKIMQYYLNRNSIAQFRCLCLTCMLATPFCIVRVYGINHIYLTLSAILFIYFASI